MTRREVITKAIAKQLSWGLSDDKALPLPPTTDAFSLRPLMYFLPGVDMPF